MAMLAMSCRVGATANSVDSGAIQWINFDHCVDVFQPPCREMNPCTNRTRASGNALLFRRSGLTLPLSRSQRPHDFAEAGAFAVHQQVDA